MTSSAPWQISVDTGGTFTDCWAIDPRGAMRRCKVLSSSRLRCRIAEVTGPRSLRIDSEWETRDGFFEKFALRCGNNFTSPVIAWSSSRRELTLDAALPHGLEEGELAELTSGEEAPVLGARLLTGTRLDEPFPPLEFRLATTIATNALLERKGARVLFVVTKGFRDLLRIRDQRRPELFALDHRRPAPLHDAVVEVDERLDASGGVLRPVRIDAAFGKALQGHFDEGIRSVAVALLHSHLNSDHEKQIERTLRAIGYEHITLSSEIAPFIKILPRAGTSVVNACLAPLVENFLERVRARLFYPAGGDEPLLVMTSGGGLEARTSCNPVHLLLSGPAGGVVGAASAARACGFRKVIAFDMGGTSTDVARIDGDLIYRFEHSVGDAHILAPALNIHTVAAGGGSICRFDRLTGLHVGPESAGAHPGPAAYGKGGPLTITDVNLLLGRIDPESASIPLEPAASREAFENLLEAMEIRDASEERRRHLLEGLLAIAVERMADAVRTISVSEGADPRDYVLVAFGGAGPLHACAVAEQLGMSRILVPPDAGLLSATGLHHAVVERFAEAQVLEPLETSLGDIPGRLEALAKEAVDHLASDGLGHGAVHVRRRIAELRLRGQDAAIALDLEPGAATLVDDFSERYRQIYGYPPPRNRPIELVALRVIASTVAPVVPPEEIAGPLAYGDPFSTLFVAPGWSGRSGERGTVLLTNSARPGNDPVTGQSSPIDCELFRNRFENIVETMGARLQRSALSTNIKERADFSCALLDSRGALVVNAPHIPVHLGALGLCVRSIIKATALRPGDMIVTNHPAYGGSHLPDVTVISPVFAGNDSPVAYVANRAHHAEIGGITPGSMPPNATCLSQEGVVIPPVHLFREGVADDSVLEELLTGAARYPTRNLPDNLADLSAQAAANLHGVRSLESLMETFGIGTVVHHLNDLTGRSALALRSILAARPLAATATREELDDGSIISLTLTPGPGGALHFDFTGSSAQHPRSLNATPAIVRSAILYVLRLFTGSDLPLNEGLLENVRITLPPGLLNPAFTGDPDRDPAVGGGNVETSQRLVDTLLKALALQACSQGTMNNFLFGNERFGYYETIAGGSGAGPGYPGCGPLHTHMTNTAITDPEILEHRYPVRLLEFSARTSSGGAGEYPGGNGAIREFEFLEKLTVSLLTSHRANAPYGLAGGCPGLPGRQLLTPPGGPTLELPPSAEIEVLPGTRLRIETPGGGGWGAPR